MKKRLLLFGVIVALPLSLHGQRLGIGETVLSYDWFATNPHLMRLDNHEDAIRMYTRRIEENPQDAAASNNLGIAYAVSEDYASAIFLLERAVALAPDNRIFQRNLDQLRNKTRLAWLMGNELQGAASDGNRTVPQGTVTSRPVVF